MGVRWHAITPSIGDNSAAVIASALNMCPVEMGCGASLLAFPFGVCGGTSSPSHSLAQSSCSTGVVGRSAIAYSASGFVGSSGLVGSRLSSARRAALAV